ncbi:zinc dependent phospholipase C family protein [Bacillus sp. 123MFChir2]|uniref:zinc dependent phospholipase C family protein n=1 Tax=Bacillus sp. 123MFChir2 TaxID=1169144 RepID=UPI000366DB37|nr:zinc dependent phospholipase C family protein [Bacillus sp. 123MFChir2]
MGSRIMHVIIADLVAKKLEIQDKTSFLLGGIAADAVHSSAEKEISHFYTGTVKNYTRKIDYDAFLNKYKAYKDFPFILGYYTHLIADNLWLQGFYLSWLKNRIEHNPNILSLYHHDFKLLNGKLLQYYDCNKSLFHTLNMNANLVCIDEVTGENIDSFKSSVFEDLLYPQQDLYEPLQVFTLDQIIGYIETSLHKSVFHLEQLRIT